MNERYLNCRSLLLYQASDQHRFYRWKIPLTRGKVLIIDDFLANGQAAKGLIQIIEQAGATVEAIGIVIENLSKMAVICLKKQGYPVLSLARLERFENGQVVFKEADL